MLKATGIGDYSWSESGSEFGSDSGSDSGTNSESDCGSDSGCESGSDFGSDFGSDSGSDSWFDSGFGSWSDSGSNSQHPILFLGYTHQCCRHRQPIYHSLQNCFLFQCNDQIGHYQTPLIPQKCVVN